MGVRGLTMFVRELAMFLGGLRVVLRLFVFAHRVVVLSLMVVMRGGVVVTGGGVVMLGRRMFCHLSALPFEVGSMVHSQTFPGSPRNWRAELCSSWFMAIGTAIRA